MLFFVQTKEKSLAIESETNAKIKPLFQNLPRNKTMKINLASTSPRRKQILEQIGIDFDLINIEIDETWDGQEPAKVHVKRMALEKAHAAKIKDSKQLTHTCCRYLCRARQCHFGQG